MKLIKYLVWILLLMGSLVFLVELNELNQFEGNALAIKIPFLIDMPEYENGFNVWMVLVMTLTAGVIIGFLLALFQIISHKSEVFSLKSKLRRVQVELDSLRNESIEDDFVLTDEVDDETL
ncbi:MAG: LapA family protein [Candidatus Marinimicrobia bacterium]|nr:LapA family protein [Candidatus Neomarinimicrobiota bacterium]